MNQHPRAPIVCASGRSVAVRAGLLAIVLIGQPLTSVASKATEQNRSPDGRQAPAHRVHALKKGPSGSDRLVSGTEQGLRVSRDRGRTWETVLVNGSDLEVLSVAVHPTQAGTLWVGRRDGIWRTDDGGGRWRAQTGAGDGTIIPLALALSPREPRVLYVSAARQGVFRSVDGGQSWDHAGRGLPKRPTSDIWEDIRTLLVDSSDPDVAYAAHKSHGVFRTRDGGAQWEPLNTGLPFARRWVASPHLVFGSSRGRVYLIVDELVHSHLMQSRIYLLASERWLPVETELPANDPILGVTFDEATQTLELWTESQTISVTAPPARRQDR